MQLDPAVIGILLSIFSSAVYITWTIGKRISDLELTIKAVEGGLKTVEIRLENHIKSSADVWTVERAVYAEKFARLDKHLHDNSERLMDLSNTILEMEIARGIKILERDVADFKLQPKKE